MSAAAHDAVSKLDALNYIGPIDPPVSFRRKAVSKFLRNAGSQGDFVAFSDDRLVAIAEQVRRLCPADAALDFFHGFTPWILTRSPRPYVAWSDCTFHDYINIYHQPSQFSSSDIDRIEQLEAEWLGRAHSVAFTSHWAARRSIERYGLSESAVHCVGIFGEAEMPETDQYQGRNQFAFVSTNFTAKGGLIAIDAFEQVLRRHPDATLVIVGASPPRGVVHPNIIFAGYLRKEVAEEAARFREILAESRALIHPTSSDIAPLILVEAGYFGCPAVSVRKFAIPELVEHQVSALLIDEANDTMSLANAMNWMLEQEADYIRMRRQALLKARTVHSKQAFEHKMQTLVRTALGQGSAMAFSERSNACYRG